MNTQNIKVGGTYKYKELCELFNEKQKTGESKIVQIKTWKCYFTWEHPINKKTKKPSKSFLITQVYDTPLERKSRGQHDNHIGKIPSEKTKLIRRAFINMLATDAEYTEFADIEYKFYNRFITMRKLGVINRNFYESKETGDMKFCYESMVLLKQWVNWAITGASYNIPDKLIIKRGTVLTDNDGIIRPANSEEEAVLRNIEFTESKKAEISGYFHAIVSRRLGAELPSIDNYTKGYFVLFDKEYIKEAQTPDCTQELKQEIADCLREALAESEEYDLEEMIKKFIM